MIRYFFLFWLLFCLQASFGQGVTTWNDSRVLPKDTVSYNYFLSFYFEDNYPAAIKIADSLMDVYSQTGNWQAFYFYLNNIVRMKYMDGDYREAIETYNRGFDLCKAEVDTVSGEHLFALQNLYSCYHRLDHIVSKNQTARSIYNIGSARNKRDSLEFFVLSVIAGTLANKEDFQTAYSSLYRAYNIAVENGWEYGYKMMVPVMASYVASVQGKDDVALLFSERVLSANPMKSTRDTLDYLSDGNTLSELYYKQGDIQKSINFCTSALRINEEVSFRRLYNRMYATYSIRLTKNYLYLDEVKKANSLFDEIEGFLLEVEDYIRLLHLYFIFAEYDYDNGNYSEALKHTLCAKNILDSSYVQDPYYFNAYYLFKSTIHLAKGNYELSADLSHRGLCFLVSGDETLLPKDSVPLFTGHSYEHQYLTLLQTKLQSLVANAKKNKDYTMHDAIVSHFNAYKDVYLRAIEDNIDDEFLDRRQVYYGQVLDELTDYFSFTFEMGQDIDYMPYIQSVASNKGYLLNLEKLQLLRAKKDDGNYGEQALLRSAAFELHNKLELARANRDTTKVNEYTDELIGLYLTILYKESRAPLFEVDKHPVSISTLDINSIQALLADNQAVVDYYIADSTVFAHVVLRDTSFFHFTNNPHINDDLKVYNQKLKTGSLSRADRSAQSVYRSLFGSIERELESVDRLIIIPDVNLAQIPLESTSCSQGEFLVEKYSISYSYSSYLWAESQERSSAQLYGSNVLIAAPFSSADYSANTQADVLRSIARNDSLIVRADNSFVPLPFTGAETKEIEVLFNMQGIATTLLQGKEASKSRILPAINQNRIIHLATHGFVDRQNPYISGLVFAPEYTVGSNQDLLYHYELYNIDLESTDLIVLSACRTAVGSSALSDAVTALPRGFIFAGVPNVIASLWKVHDQKTKDLMVAFYKNLLNGSSYAEALRLAKLECIENGFLPIDWAGFVLIGG